jgi:hypothetical protein
MFRFIIVLLFLACACPAYATDSTTSTSFDVKAAMKTLLPSIPEARAELVEDVLVSRAGKYGFTVKDYPMILAMIMTESSFQHIRGKAGEVGMLQVIPSEKHIRVIVAKIVCDPGEKYCGDNGRPAIYQKGVISSYKVKDFLWEHPKYALEAGLGEMRFWKVRYDRILKRRFWQNYPEWYLSQKVVGYWQKEDLRSDLKKWWNMVHTRAGALAWTSHYNWGSDVKPSGVTANYSMRVLRYYNKILGRKSNQIFSPMRHDPEEK